MDVLLLIIKLSVIVYRFVKLLTLCEEYDKRTQNWQPAGQKRLKNKVMYYKSIKINHISDLIKFDWGSTV
jgi:hypothetical protein